MSRANADTLRLRREAAPEGLRGWGIGGGFSLQVARIKEFGILGTSLRDIEFLVGGSDIGMPLIGANLPDIADLDIDLARGKLRMMKAQGKDCDRASMAYWAKTTSFSAYTYSPSSLSDNHNEKCSLAFTKLKCEENIKSAPPS